MKRQREKLTTYGNWVVAEWSRLTNATRCRSELKSKLTEEQMARYDVYRASGFSKNQVKRTMQRAGATAAIAETWCDRQLPSFVVFLSHTSCFSTVVLAGITKVFVGEVVELGESRPHNGAISNASIYTQFASCIVVYIARSIEDEWNETGPLQPKHVREAYRRLRASGALPYAPVQPLMRRRRRC